MSWADWCLERLCCCCLEPELPTPLGLAPQHPQVSRPRSLPRLSPREGEWGRGVEEGRAR